MLPGVNPCRPFFARSEPEGHFHNDYIISTPHNASEPTLSQELSSIITFRGRAIFQKKRADDSHRGNRKRNPRSLQATGCLCMAARKLLQRVILEK
jgi:hypothetical protein